MIGNIFDETLGTSIIDGTAINTHNPQAFYSSINGNTQTAFFFCPDFSITGTVTFSVAFVIVSAGAANFSGSFGGAGVVHGKRFQVEAGGTLHATSLTSLPGDLPGTNYGGELAVGSDDYMGPWPTSKSLQTPVAGFSITIADNIGLLILTPAGTLGTGTITTPANPIDQQTLTITSTQTISVLTVSPNAGQSVSGNPATLAANGAITAHYNASNTTWYMSTSSVSGGGGGTIGGAVGGGTVGSVLFVGAGSTLAQDNAEFFWDDTSFILKIAGELDFQSASALFKVSGTDRLDYAVTTAGRWTAFGDIALDSSNHRYFIGSAVAITVVPNVSGNNWFEGAAGNTSLTGYGNFGTGDLALSSITTGFLNVAVGRNAMQNSLDAFENIALGTQSLHFTQSDSSNIAIGFNALETLGNGGAGGGNNVQNVSVGFGALGNVSIAFGNVVIGANGLSNIAAPTTAIQNVVIGQSAGNG